MTDELAAIVEAMSAAIDRDLTRQAEAQISYYEPMDECGIAGADMNIVLEEIARAALAAALGPLGEVAADKLECSGTYLNFREYEKAATIVRDRFDAFKKELEGVASL